jgi:cation transporter-like permease
MTEEETNEETEAASIAQSSLIMNKKKLPHLAVSNKLPLRHHNLSLPPISSASKSPPNLSISSSKNSPTSPVNNRRIRKRIVTKLSTDDGDELDSSFSSCDLEEDGTELRELERLRTDNARLREENDRLMDRLDDERRVDERSWHDGIINSLTSVISPKSKNQNRDNITSTRNRRPGSVRAKYKVVVQEPDVDNGSFSKSRHSFKFPTNHQEGDGKEKNGNNGNNAQFYRKDEESNNDGLDNLEIVQSMSNVSNLLETESFRALFLDRASWLVGLLILQSISGFILQSNENMLQEHLAIVNFLTMLVGAGGNAGNQASVQAIRGLAIGWLNPITTRAFLRREGKMALCLAVTLGLTGFIRAALFETDSAETIAITTSLIAIVLISVALGSLLPLGMVKCRIDPAHSSTTIQVLMDILGVSITCLVSSYILNISSLKDEAL